MKMYKHYKNKQDLFDTIIEVASKRINELQNDLISRFSEEEEVENSFPVEKIQHIYCKLFSFYITDDILSKFRRMMIIEQFKNIELNNKFNEMFIEKTLSYQKEIFRELINTGKINGTNPEIMAIHFYSPIFMLLFRYDLKDDRVDEALSLIKEHIKEFFRLYLK